MVSLLAIIKTVVAGLLVRCANKCMGYLQAFAEHLCYSVREACATSKNLFLLVMPTLIMLLTIKKWCILENIFPENFIGSMPMSYQFTGVRCCHLEVKLLFHSFHNMKEAYCLKAFHFFVVASVHVCLFGVYSLLTCMD